MKALENSCLKEEPSYYVRVKHNNMQDLVYLVTDQDSTFGNLITQSAYIWDLSASHIYFLSLQNRQNAGSLKLFPNDSRVLPYLKKHITKTEGTTMILFLQKYDTKGSSSSQG